MAKGQKKNSFSGPRYLHNSQPQTIITGGEGFALTFTGTNPHNGDENESVGDEDDEEGNCEVKPCIHKQGSLLHVSVRTC